MGIPLPENEAERIIKLKQWREAAKLVAKSSQAINKEFQRHSLLKSK